MLNRTALRSSRLPVIDGTSTPPLSAIITSPVFDAEVVQELGHDYV